MSEDEALIYELTGEEKALLIEFCRSLVTQVDCAQMGTTKKGRYPLLRITAHAKTI